MRRYRGRIIGLLLGFIVAGPMGAFMGLVLGYIHDKRRPIPLSAFETTRQHFDKAANRRSELFPFGMTDSLHRSTYLIGIIVLSAKLAKSDGRVSRSEINCFRKVFHIPDSELAHIGTLFDQARTSSEGYEPYAARLAQVFRYTPLILEEILYGLFCIANIDGPGLSRQEEAMLRRLSLIFNFDRETFMRVARRAGLSFSAQSSYDSDETAGSSQNRGPDPAATMAPHYATLGLPATASDSDIKKTYRVLIRKYHPDKLLAKGLPPEMIVEATEKMKRINAAYAALCKDRGIR